MWERIRRKVNEAGDIMELCMAFAVIAGLAITIVCFLPEMKTLVTSGGGTKSFLVFLEEVFSIVVGIEFLKMLCKPTSDNVIEVLLFLVARHMIIGTNTAVDNLLYIVSIGVLYLIKNYLHDRKGARAIERVKMGIKRDQDGEVILPEDTEKSTK